MIRPKESILQMEPYAAPEGGRIGCLRLDFNENTRGPSPKALEAIRKVTLEECGCYPEYEDFTLALSQFLGVLPANVMPTNGSDEAIRALFDTYVEKGDEVVLLSPSYALYENFAQVAGAKIKWVSYGPNFSFPIQEVVKAITPNTRLIALANPNNPTGTLIDRVDLKKIIEANPKMVVLLDEAYGQFARTTNIDFINQYSNVFVTQTFSKAYGLAALRIGYLISSASNIEVISKVISPAYSVNRLAMLAATAVMDDQDYYATDIDDTINVKSAFENDLKAIGFIPVKSAANFVLVFFGEQAEPVRRALLQKNILVRARSEQCLKGYMRISIGTRAQMQALVEDLKLFAKAGAQND